MIVSPPSVARARPRLLFAKGFIDNPRGIGSVIPSSRQLTERLLAGTDWCEARTIVEYGPGTGVVTRALLARMAPEARLFAFETNADFVGFLGSAIRDPRLTIIGASAETVGTVLTDAGLATADVVVSSLPFSIMPPRVRLRILRATARVLAPGAALVGYQYTRRWLWELRRVFGDVAVQFEWRNWPPAFVFEARA